LEGSHYKSYQNIMSNMMTVERLLQKFPELLTSMAERECMHNQRVGTLKVITLSIHSHIIISVIY